MDTDHLRSAITLIAIDGLRPYERPDQPGVARVARSLIEHDHLIDPVIVDPKRCLLIDGHHRVNALTRLGYEFVPAFCVDYFSETVDIRGWLRITDASTADVREVLSASAQRQSEHGRWHIVASKGDGQGAEGYRFSDPWTAALSLDWAADLLMAGGWQVDLTPASLGHPERRSWTHLSMTPTVGRHEVWDAALGNRRFPNEVNRHLVQGRPVDLCAPLAEIGTPQRFHAWLETRLSSSTWHQLEGGITHIGRFYEETIVAPWAPASEAS